MISLKRLTLEDGADIEGFVSKFAAYSDFNFVSLYSWSLHSQTMFYLNNGMLLLKLPDYSSQESIYTFMILENLDENVSGLIDYFVSNNIQLSFSLIPEELVPNLRKHLMSRNYGFRFEEDRGNFDYLLDIKKIFLAEGHEYSDYRYKLSKFSRDWGGLVTMYNFDVEKREDVMQAEKLLKDWVLAKDKNNLDYEFEGLAFSRFLQIAQRSKNLGYKAFKYKGELVALSSYELIDDTRAIGHFIKYNPEIRNIFYYLVNETCKDLYRMGINELNIEQDLNIIALRQSKMHLRPKGFLKKYSLDIAG